MRLLIIAALTAMTPMVAAQAQQHQKAEQRTPGKVTATNKAPAKSGTRADRCKRAYKSYDVKTGRYRDAKGRSRPCAL